MDQLTMFAPAGRYVEGLREVVIPPAVASALGMGALLAISVSGGKDSQAMLEALAGHPDADQWTGLRRILHADLGRAEWPQTPGHIRFIADRVGMDLQVVNRPQGDLLAEIQKRVRDLAGTESPVWPDAGHRYCTSDQKRAQLDKAVRNPWPTSSMRYCTADQKRDQMTKVHRSAKGGIAVAAIGMRASESKARAKRPVLVVNQRVSATYLRGLSPADAVAAWTLGKRLVLDWLPIHEWSDEDVWRAIGHSAKDLDARRAMWKAGDQDAALKGWLGHPAYVIGKGNKRLSCSLCVLGCESDLENGGRYNPELLKAYVEIEAETGWSFKQHHALADLAVTRELYPELAAQAVEAIANRASQ